jgi:hypothetical protein
MREGYVVSHVAGPNDERVDMVDIRAWCSAHAKPLIWPHAIFPPLPAALDDRGSQRSCFIVKNRAYFVGFVRIYVRPTGQAAPRRL